MVESGGWMQIACEMRSSAGRASRSSPPHLIAMPAEHHDPTGHSICPVRVFASPPTGVLMKPWSTSFGWSRPALSQYKLAPPHFRGCASPEKHQFPGGQALH